MSGDDGGQHRERVRRVAAALDRSRLSPGAPQPCSYLPGREACHVAFAVSDPPPGFYHALMDLNYRRSGAVFYRPACEACDECRAIRVEVGSFQPSRAQKRCWSRNADLEITIAEPSASAEKHALYRRYLATRHDGQMDGSEDELERFLYSSPIRTIELEYRLAGQLLAVGLADVEPAVLSAVYCYFDPDERSRSLGVFNVLRMIEECRRRGLSHLYLGYYLHDCQKMRYKREYRPNEILDLHGRWLRSA